MTSSVMATLLAGIAYDPEIRGVIVVLVGGGVLMGSVYIILATDIGARLGFQLALAALCGWLMLLGMFWWIYGVGAIGDLPEWHVEEINIGEISEAQLEEAQSLEPDALPDPAEILEQHPEVAEAFEEGDVPTLSEIASVPDLPDELVEQLENLPGGWAVLPQAELGDAQAAADIALTTGDVALYESATEYVVLGGFNRGGKPDRESDSLLDRAANRITNTLQILNPPHYAVVQVQTSESTAVPVGSAPLSPTPDGDEPVVSVILVRDLGTRRLPAAVMTFAFGLLFALMCALLHQRDRRSAELSSPTAGG